MHRRTFVKSMTAALVLPAVGCASVGQGRQLRRLKRVGIQLYSLRAAAAADLERTLADIAAIGYNDVELLGSMNNFGMPPARLRAVLDRVGLRAPSTHVRAELFDNLDRNLDVANMLGHQQIIIAGFPESRIKTLDDYRYWADKLNEAGRIAHARGVWIGFHNHTTDVTPIGGGIPYHILLERTDPAVVHMQLDTGNLLMAGLDPMTYLERYGSRYFSFHLKDAPSLRAEHDTELGKGILDIPKFLAAVDHLDDKLVFVEQESYPGAPIDSLRRDYGYLSALQF
jgi:sugar phosphate isomerase/epimerase